MKYTANIWEYKFGINAIIANFDKYVRKSRLDRNYKVLT